jgi:hypothetical protein
MSDLAQIITAYNTSTIAANTSAIMLPEHVKEVDFLAKGLVGKYSGGHHTFRTAFWLLFGGTLYAVGYLGGAGPLGFITVPAIAILFVYLFISSRLKSSARKRAAEEAWNQ